MYALNHLYLAPALQRNITYGFYESGHMVYLHPASLAQFHADLERWYADALAQCVSVVSAIVAGRHGRRPLPPSARRACDAAARTPDAVTQHTIALGGKTYPYTARAGTIALAERQG